ncbi:MAG TPA: NAD(+) synthase [Clostridia bacterium]
MDYGFIRVAAATPEIIPADCDHNAKQIIELINKADAFDAQVVVFPELCVTGYTCGDLFFQDTLLKAALDALKNILDASINLEMLIIVGLPLSQDQKLYNCAAVISKGKILGLVPKKNLPEYDEFYESRYFTGGEIDKKVNILGQETYLSNRQIFADTQTPEFKIGVEICEDLWVIYPPSIDYIKAGAFLIANLSASNEAALKAETRRLLVTSQSARGICGYIYCDAGTGESTTDMVFSGHNIIAENGVVIAESELFSSGLTINEIDLQLLKQIRLKTKSIPLDKRGIREIPFSVKKKINKLIRYISKTPFLPEKNDGEYCDYVLNIQARALSSRLKAAGIKKVCLGLSGGLDSTWALYVALRAFEMLGYDRQSIIAVSMPSSANTSRTKSNSKALAKIEGVTFWEIPINDSLSQHIKDINLGLNNFGTAYENAQARERTQILMDIANEIGALMIGTGDLSELALGFTTYGGDHMSMYSVNASIPKTLIRYLIGYIARTTDNPERAKILNDILNTPISPELLPSNQNEISQKTESIIGPYELHDFFLYYAARYGFGPKKIYRLARQAFLEEYTDDEIKKWLGVFYKRFFANQFKRSCMPDGPKVTEISLSPRADFRMPSDASVKVWQKELEML